MTHICHIVTLHNVLKVKYVEQKCHFSLNMEPLNCFGAAPRSLPVYNIESETHLTAGNTAQWAEPTTIRCGNLAAQ